MSDYEKISQAIQYIDEQRQSQPGLDDVASHIGISRFHFQRMFSQWAGVSPKRLLQVLTLQDAKKLIDASSAPLLDIAHEAGLSSSSRLYDHFIHIEAVSPSEYKSRGQGLTIWYAEHDTPFGQIFIAGTKLGVCRLEFIELSGIDDNLNRLKRKWPEAELSHDQYITSQWVKSLFDTPRKNSGPLSLWVYGTNFQLQVWQALLRIPEGQLVSYGDIAESIGKPKAVRAVGTAVGDNPVALLIPCHRVLRKDGSIGGYRWGEDKKRLILAREIARREIKG